MTNGERNGFDKLSYETGRNGEAIEQLTKLFEKHCDDDDRRHVENVKLLTDNTAAVKELKDALKPIAANYALTRRRMALLASIGLGILMVASWVLETAVKWAVGWLFKVKFGGP